MFYKYSQHIEASISAYNQVHVHLKALQAKTHIAHAGVLFYT